VIRYAFRYLLTIYLVTIADIQILFTQLRPEMV